MSFLENYEYTIYDCNQSYPAFQGDYTIEPYISNMEFLTPLYSNKCFEEYRLRGVFFTTDCLAKAYELCFAYKYLNPVIMERERTSQSQSQLENVSSIAILFYLYTRYGRIQFDSAGKIRLLSTSGAELPWPQLHDLITCEFLHNNLLGTLASRGLCFRINKKLFTFTIVLETEYKVHAVQKFTMCENILLRANRHYIHVFLDQYTQYLQLNPDTTRIELLTLLKISPAYFEFYGRDILKWNSIYAKVHSSSHLPQPTISLKTNENKVNTDPHQLKSISPMTPAMMIAPLTSMTPITRMNVSNKKSMPNMDQELNTSHFSIISCQTQDFSTPSNDSTSFTELSTPMTNVSSSSPVVIAPSKSPLTSTPIQSSYENSSHPWKIPFGVKIAKLMGISPPNANTNNVKTKTNIEYPMNTQLNLSTLSTNTNTKKFPIISPLTMKTST